MKNSFIVILFCILTCVVQAGHKTPSIQKVSTSKAPAPIGTYSQALKVNNLVYISGQIGMAAGSNQLVEEDITKQAHQVFENINSICKASGGSLSQVVKLTIYLTDLKDFGKVNQVMAQWFKEPYPARVMVEVSKLPKEAKIEVDAILYVK